MFICVFCTDPIVGVLYSSRLLSHSVVAVEAITARRLTVLAKPADRKPAGLGSPASLAVRQRRRSSTGSAPPLMSYASA